MPHCGSSGQRLNTVALDRAYPVAIIQDRYFGLYSGGLWFAIAMADAPWGPVDPEPSRAQFCLDEGPNGTDEEAVAFWRSKPSWIAVGNTPGEAVERLTARI